MTVYVLCVCVCLWISGYFCTQDTLPTLPECSTPTPVARVSQYACQRRTTTENNNKIFTVRNSYLTLLWTQLHVHPREAVNLTLQCKKVPVICSALIGWLARFTHQRFPENILTLQMSSVLQHPEVQQLTCPQSLARGLAWTRPKAPSATPGWAADVTLLTNSDGSVPLPSGGQHRMGGRNVPVWGSGSLSDVLRCWWAWKKREIMLHLLPVSLQVWKTRTQEPTYDQCINQNKLPRSTCAIIVKRLVGLHVWWSLIKGVILCLCGLMWSWMLHKSIVCIVFLRPGLQWNNQVPQGFSKILYTRDISLYMKLVVCFWATAHVATYPPSQFLQEYQPQ